MGVAGGLHHLGRIEIGGEEVGQAGADRDPEDFVNPGLAHVRVNDQGPALGLGHGQGQVDRVQGFPLKGGGTGDQNGFRGTLGGGKENPGPDQPESLGGVGVGMGQNHELIHGGFFAQSGKLDRRDRAQEGQVEFLFDLVRGFNRGVQVFKKEGETDAQG